MDEPRALAPYREAAPEAPGLDVDLGKLEPELQEWQWQWDAPRRAPRSYWLTYAGTGVASSALAYAASGSSLLGMGVALVAGAAFSWCSDRWFFAPRDARRFSALMAAPRQALVHGRFTEAEAGFYTVFRKFRGRPPLQARAIFDLAINFGRRGDPWGALRILKVLHVYPGTRQAPEIALAVPFEIAGFLAQIGEVAGAAQWLFAARAWAGGLENLASYALAALIALRAGRLDTAEEVYGRHWVELEASLTMADMRRVYVQRAFALEQAGAPVARVVHLVELARPSQDHELTWMGAGWEEMSEFLVRHELTKGRSLP